MTYWLGVGVEVSVAVLLIGAAAAFALNLLQEAVWKIHRRGWAEGMEDYKNRLHTYAWWFSEDEPTMKLLGDIAELEVYVARENWRKARVQKSEAPR